MARLLLFDIGMTWSRAHGAGRKSIDATFVELYGIEAATSDSTIDGRTDKGTFHEALAGAEFVLTDLSDTKAVLEILST